jgi:VWFA-related protein
LQRQGFTLLDDKQPQKILSFRQTDLATDETSDAVDPAVQLILFVDAVNTSFHNLSYERQQINKFLQQNGSHLPLPTSLFLMTDTYQGQTGVTRDGNTLVDALNSNQSGLRTIGRSQGFYGAEDRVQISLSTLEKFASHLSTEPGRKLLIWISPGWPLLSGPNVQLTDQNRKWLFQNVVNLSTELREAGVTLSSVDPMGMEDAGSFQTFLYESFLKGVNSANNVQNGNLRLQVLAVQSGGRVLTSSNDITKSLATCLSDARVFYTLSFYSPPADHPDEYHSLQVKIGKPGLTARTRTGYYAQREQH